MNFLPDETFLSCVNGITEHKLLKLKSLKARYIDVLHNIVKFWSEKNFGTTGLFENIRCNKSIRSLERCYSWCRLLLYKLLSE